MNKNQINKIFFEDLYKTQTDKMNHDQLKKARKVILKLITHVSNKHRDDIAGKDDVLLDALEWLKNNQS